MKKQTVFFLILFTFFFQFCLTCQAKTNSTERPQASAETNNHLPSLDELKTWSFMFYDTVVMKFEDKHFKEDGKAFVFTAPENHYLFQIMVVITRKDDGKIYAYAQGCWVKGRPHPEPCDLIEPSGSWGENLYSKY